MTKNQLKTNCEACKAEITAETPGYTLPEQLKGSTGFLCRRCGDLLQAITNEAAKQKTA